GLLVLPGARLSEDIARDAADRARRLSNSVLVLFIVTTVWRLAAQGDLVASGPTRPMAAMMTVVRETRWGTAWLVGAMGALIVAMGLLLARTGSIGWIIAGVGAVAIAFSEGLTGHAVAMRPATFATVVDAAHVLGAGGWLGGLAAVALCGLAATHRAERGGGTDASRQLVRSFHRSAVPCVAVLLRTAP